MSNNHGNNASHISIACNTQSHAAAGDATSETRRFFFWMLPAAAAPSFICAPTDDFPVDARGFLTFRFGVS
eukprot:CAMPEP_0195570732 /NCGR_PEP_ID=MMETSP0814-20130614/3647_1 /TAXON_ID=97485 /ORGANISM="Prymnesium parvum, Strain Texoma1" /LENGTH=70 /DNA_ID=CAMNT_0040706271 /DNA_START=152 /DNA_END=361 /DNA_ORIENTATION=-